MGAAFAVPTSRYRQAPVKEHKQKTRPSGARFRQHPSLTLENLAVFEVEVICVNANLFKRL